MVSKRRNSRPTAQDAARRVVILKHIAVAALIEPPREMLAQVFEGWTADEREQFARDGAAKREQIWEPLQAAGLWQHMSPWELEYAQTDAVSMTSRQQIDATWRTESAMVFMWALHLIEDLPPWDIQADQGLLKAIPSEDIDSFIGTARLRNSAEVDGVRDAAELWHWRSRTRQLIEDGDACGNRPVPQYLGRGGVNKR